MAIATFKPSGKTVVVTIQAGTSMFTYNLTDGYNAKDVSYEMNHTFLSASGLVSSIDPENNTLKIGDKIIDPSSIVKVGNRPDLVTAISMTELDTTTGGVIADTVGKNGKDVTIIIGTDTVIEKGEYGPDDQINVDDYIEIVDESKPQPMKDLIYDQKIQKISYIQANMVAVFREWFTSFFEPTYFRHIRIKTESSYTKFKSFMKDIYKKEPPLLVIDPNTIEHVDDFLFGTNVVNRYNIVDPHDDNVGAKILYSLAMVESEKINLHYRRNRYRFRFDVLMMERSLDRALDLHNFLIMNLRHQSQFMLFRRVANLLPTNMIRSIAKINGFQYPDDKFLNWINAHAIGCTIVKRILPSGQTLFFAEQDCHIQVEVPDMPAHDSPEMSDAIEIAARVTDSFIFTVDLPSEYFCTMDHSVTMQYERYREGDDPDIAYITKSDDYKWEEGMELEMGEYTLFNRSDVMIPSAEDNQLRLLDVIRDIDPQTCITIDTLIHDSDINLSEPLIKVRIITRNAEYHDYSVSEDYVLTINNPDYSKLYHVYVYVNQKYVNLYASAINSRYIGSIPKTAY